MQENVYRQGPGPVVDKAWEALGVDCWSRTTVIKYLANLWQTGQS
jgi:hypothetical protein